MGTRLASTELSNRTHYPGQQGMGKKGGDYLDVDHQSHKGPWENDDKAEGNQKAQG